MVTDIDINFETEDELRHLNQSCNDFCKYVFKKFQQPNEISGKLKMSSYYFWDRDFKFCCSVRLAALF
jgi:hypothetical protein